MLDACCFIEPHLVEEVIRPASGPEDASKGLQTEDP